MVWQWPPFLYLHDNFISCNFLNLYSCETIYFYKWLRLCNSYNKRNWNEIKPLSHMLHCYTGDYVGHAIIAGVSASNDDTCRWNTFTFPRGESIGDVIRDSRKSSDVLAKEGLCNLMCTFKILEWKGEWGSRWV